SSISAAVGSTASFQAQEMRNDCYTSYGPYDRSGDSTWTTTNSSVATVAGGAVQFHNPGSVTINAQFNGTVYTNYPAPCSTQTPSVNPGSGVTVFDFFLTFNNYVLDPPGTG